MRVICERIVCSVVRRVEIVLAGEQRLHQRGNRRERIIHLVRDAGGEGAGGGEAFGLQQLVEHLAAMGDVVQDHLDEALVAVGDQRGIVRRRIMARAADRGSGRSRCATTSRKCSTVPARASSAARNPVMGRPISGRCSSPGALRCSLRSAAELAPSTIQRVGIDLVHRIGRVIDEVAILLFRRAQRRLARLDVEPRHHQAPLVDRGDHDVAHLFHLAAARISHRRG